eukprot:TRINITY_DN28246_c0_g1_i7.p1 TRINITY_DN28246_c0_g1~~TRINITY_DN28246_c0_g1_i7.p1  ORF type:complete len:390 (-),score=40.73 TRINITY_DN28246_c0_g1_i7:333-1502(-)
MRVSLARRVSSSWRFSHAHGLFSRTEKPIAGTQLPNLGAMRPWSDIMSSVSTDPDQKLLLLLRHGQALENLAPNNTLCNFTVDNILEENWDSRLTLTGTAQAANVSTWLSSEHTQGDTWAQLLRLGSAARFVSPLMRTLQTAAAAFDRAQPAVASSLLRASLGRHVCNAQHPVHSSAEHFPPPWNTMCPQARNPQSLRSLWDEELVDLPVRPAGGASPGLVSTQDILWRSDYEEEDAVTSARVTAFLVQLFASVPQDVVVVVTHGEIVTALGEVVGEPELSAANAQVVPVVVKYLGTNQPKESDHSSDDDAAFFGVFAFLVPMMLLAGCIMLVVFWCRFYRENSITRPEPHLNFGSPELQISTDEMGADGEAANGRYDRCESCDDPDGL